MTDCVFCKIANGEIKTPFLYEDDKVVVFEDLNPVAPVHLLIIPKNHIETTNHIDDDNAHIIGHIYKVAAKMAKELNLEKGYRVVNNCLEEGGQSVFHIHFHLLAGRQMMWPPG